MLNITIDKTVGILQVLTDKLSGINDKAKENTLLNQDYEDLNNKIDILSGMFDSNSNSNESDIVSLLNLPRLISEYTNDNIGEIISIPYVDESGKILLNGGCIEFEVVGVNHHKDINDESKPTITLMTKNSIRKAAFDAQEQNNPDSNRANWGNNRWSVSNIRQWLNSNVLANSWFTPQHEYDESPTADKVYDSGGAYADDPGFLAGFSQDIKSHFGTIANTTWIYKTSTSDITNDKVFLASYTEITGYNNSNIAEGTHLSVRYPQDDDQSRIKSDFYWLRSATSYESSQVCLVRDADGAVASDMARFGLVGIAPLVVLI